MACDGAMWRKLDSALLSGWVLASVSLADSLGACFVLVDALALYDNRDEDPSLVSEGKKVVQEQDRYAGRPRFP